MKKVTVMLAAAAVSLGVCASVPRQVQGIPYTPKKAAAAVSTASDYPSDPGDLAVPDGDFTFDMIQSWSGEGSKKAALVIQWNEPSETYALVFGYRWDGQATGADMLRAVTEDNPQLYSLIQYTNVSSPTDPNGGYTINGIGWDKDADGDIALIDTGHGNQRYTSETGLFIHPRGYVPGQGGSPSYDYDDWKAADTDDYWGAGWFLSYWSYWVKSSADATFSYSSWGASGRVLTDGCWDGWNFARGMMSSAWKPFKAAPAPIPEGALTEFKVDGLYYTLGNYAGRTVSLVAPFKIEGETLSTYSGDITVPATIEADGNVYSVSEIKPNAFENAQIGTVTLPATVRKIGDYAFKGSTLSRLVLPENAAVPTLGKGTFSGCASFSQTLLPEGIKAIPDELYKGTAITELTIPEGVESIGEQAFTGCKELKALVIPACVKTIGKQAFQRCTGLRTLEFLGDVKTIDDAAFIFCNGLTKVSVGTTYPPQCSDMAFSNKTYTNATLFVPTGYTQAYASAEGWNSFKKIEEFGIEVNVGDVFALNGVSYKVVSVAEGDMNVCATYHKTEGAPDRKSIAAANLAGYTGAVTVPAKVSYQGREFNVSSLNDSIFYGAAKLLSVVLPEGITAIPRHAFYECSKLENVDIPSTVTTIGTYAFSYCSVVDNIKLPESITTLGDRCFFQTPALANINIPSGITALPQYCFSYSGLTSIVLGENISTLSSYCFQSCKNLESIVLPSALKAIPNNAFQNCSSLRTITIPESVTSLGSSVFSGCSMLESITIPKGITSFGSSMFQNCSSLKEVIISENIVNLGTNVFSGCSSLEKVTLSPNVTAIPSSAFSGCAKLHTIAYHGQTEPNEPGIIRLAEGTKSIAQYAFQNCKAIKEVILPDGFTTIGGREVFKNTGLTQLVLPASVSSMNQNYICGDNAAVTFYLCATKPATVNRFTFAKASGDYAFPIIVPTGYAETYKKASNWDYYTISEPTVESFVLSDVNFADGKLSGKLAFKYGAELPERFATANNEVLGKDMKFTLSLSNGSSEVFSTEFVPGSDLSFNIATGDFRVEYGMAATVTATKNETSYKTATTDVEAPVNIGSVIRIEDIYYEIVSIEEGERTVMVTHCPAEGNQNETNISKANLAGYTGEIVIPESVSIKDIEYNVVGLKSYAFCGARELTSVVLSEGISIIPDYAFRNCTKLTDIAIPSTVTETGKYSLSATAIQSISLGENFTKLGDYTFQFAESLESIVIPSNVTKISDYCFRGCKSLKTASIPEGVTGIGVNAFQDCSALEALVLPDGLSELAGSAFTGCSSLKEISIPEGIVFDKPYEKMNLFQNCSSLEKVTLSSKITAIPNQTFTGCSKLHTIAFHGCTEETTPGVVRLPQGVTMVGTRAFQYCSSIKEIILPEEFKSITGREAFAYTGIEEVVFPASTINLSENFICGGNESVTFYMCGTTPPSVNRFSFTKVANNFEFPIVVPTGYAETYKKAPSWNYYTVIEPEVTALVLADAKFADGKLSGRLTLNYTTELPERFAAANSAVITDGATVSVTLANEGSEPVKAEIVLEADGSFEIAFDNFKAKKGLTATASIVKGATSYVSEATAVSADFNVPFAFSTTEYDAHFDEKFTPELVFEDETFNAASLSFSSSNTDVASVNAKTGLVTVKRTAGDAVIRAYVTAEPDIFTEMTIHAALRKPVEKYVLGDGSEDITLSYMDILALCPTVEPADADIQTYDISISDPEIATTYSVTAFNPTRKFFELVTHKPGTVDVTFKSQDGSGVQTTYHVTVEEPDRAVASDSWQDGTFWLNEDWFGHTNGSINYITADGNVRYRAYESQNAYESFGCTSQYAMIFGGKLYVMSKQATDGGDTRKGGGRLVVADAKTLKKLAAFDDILDDGDGRACVGVNASKVYVGTTAGIAVFNPETLEITGKVDGIEAGSKYANQIGDMVCAGKYVFAIKQNFGTLVIDTETDAVVKVLGRDENGTTTAYPQGVTMTADGKVWIAATDGANSRKTSLFCYDTTDLSLVKSIEMPSHMSITCGWGSWRPTNFFSENDETAIWFGSGVDNTIVSGNTGYYRWDTNADLSTLAPVFVFPTDLEGIDSSTKQAPYAGVRYDSRNNRLLVAATHGASSNYRYNWLHFVDCATGEIANTIRLKDYYWFPALPVFPDKYAPEFESISPVELEVTDDREGIVIDLSVSDRDNMDSAIKVSLMDAEEEGCFAASLEGLRLTVVPVAVGEGELGLRAESNGVATYLSVPVTVSDAHSGINGASVSGSMSITGRRFHATGFNGHTMRVYNAAGAAVAEFEVMSDDFSILLPVDAGFYIIADKDSHRTIKCIIK